MKSPVLFLAAAALFGCTLPAEPPLTDDLHVEAAHGRRLALSRSRLHRQAFGASPASPCA